MKTEGAIQNNAILEAQTKDYNITKQKIYSKSFNMRHEKNYDI